MEIGNWKLEIGNFRRGVVSLGATILLGGIMIEIGIAVALLSYFVNLGSAGSRLSAYALSAAQSGVDDGILRVTRNELPSPTPSPYPVVYAQYSTASATVTVCSGNPSYQCSSPDPNPECSTSAVAKYVIISVGQSGSQPPFRKRKLCATLEVDPAAWLVRVEKVIEVPL